MSAFIIYLIKANIALTLFYLAYRFILRRLTFYRINRGFLLTGIGVSALFPLINFSAFSQHHQEFTAAVTTYSPHWENLVRSVQPETLSIWMIVEYIFWIGVALMSLRFIMQLLSLLRIHLKAQKERSSKGTFYRTKEPLNPFSFFHHIYVNPDLHSPEELSTIIAHEKMHVKGQHSVDILLGEINTIFYWFNPGAWLMKLAIRENLEFLTDQRLLDAGINAQQYQYSLLKTITGLSPNPLTNQFNIFHLKERIKMMNKKRSSKRNLLRYFILTPLLLGVVLVFTFSQNHKMESFLIKDTVVVPTGKSAQFYADKGFKLLEKKDYKAAEKFAKKAALINPDNPKAKYTLIYVKQIKKYQKKKSAYLKKHGKPMSVPPPPPPPIPESLSQDSTAKKILGQTSKEHLPKDYTDFLNRNPSIKGVSWSLSSYSIETDRPTIAILRFKDGTKKRIHLTNPSEMKKVVKQYGNLPVPPTPPPGYKKKTAIKNVPNAQYIVDGQKVDPSDFKNIKPEDIYSINVYKDSATVAQLPKGKKGLIKIVTKAYHKAHPEEFHSQKAIKKKDRRKTVPNAQYMVDGQIMDPKDFKENIKPEDIYSINVYKDSATVAKLPKGKTGLIKIVTKAYHKAHPEEFPATREKRPVDTASKVYSFVPQMPIYPGGEKALLHFLNQHLKYPPKARDAGVQGTIVVQFVVQKKGGLSHIETVGEKKGYGLEEEALRIVKLMPKWTPGKRDGQAVPVRYELPIRFVLQNNSSQNHTSPNIVPDSSTGHKTAQTALKALRKKQYSKAEHYAHKALKENPNDRIAPQVLDYIKRIKAYQQKKKEYKEQHPAAQQDTGIDVSVHYTPTEDITSKLTSEQQTQPFLREFSPNNYHYFVNGKEVNPTFIKQNLHPQYIGSIRILKKDALPKQADQKKGRIYIQLSQRKKYLRQLTEKTKVELSQPAAPKLDFNKSPSTSIQLSINRKLDADSLSVFQKGFREWGIKIAYKNLKFNQKGYLVAFNCTVKNKNGFLHLKHAVPNPNGIFAEKAPNQYRGIRVFKQKEE